MPYRISGHESFTCRYTWLPKVVQCVQRDDQLLSKDEEAMVELGVGKNMVRSIRFWSQAAGVVETTGKNGKLRLTNFGKALLGSRGFDPFLEDIKTLWLIHWKLATNTPNPLLAWDFLLNCWQEPEIVPSTVVAALQREVAKHNDKASPSTLEHHFDAFLHTYVPTRGRKGRVQEDNLDCPLVELALIVKVGEREANGSLGRRESIYAFRREDKPEISQELFVYCLNSFWQSQHPNEATLSFREVAHGHGSPGQIFKLPEDDIRTRVEITGQEAGSPFSYVDSANLQQIQRRENVNDSELLGRVYKTDGRRN
jgi:Protein of unknown function (DUF4007)